MTKYKEIIIHPKVLINGFPLRWREFLDNQSVIIGENLTQTPVWHLQVLLWRELTSVWHQQVLLRRVLCQLVFLHEPLKGSLHHRSCQQAENREQRISTTTQCNCKLVHIRINFKIEPEYVHETFGW